MMLRLYRKLSVRMFGWLARITENSFSSIEPQLRSAGISMLLRTWVSIVYMTVFLVYSISLALVLSLHLVIGFEGIEMIYYIIFVPVLTASLAFLTIYLYPAQKAKSAAKSIESNLPFALIHMSALSSSGIPPEFMFELLSRFREYGEMSRQMALVSRNIKTFGMSSVAALTNVASTTPSKTLKQILNGIASIIERGGNLEYYLNEMSEKTLFDYRMRREKYSKTLSTLSDVYTALLITAPLMLISVVVMMNMIGGDIFGLGIGESMILMIGFVVAANVIYLAFLEMSYPGK